MPYTDPIKRELDHVKPKGCSFHDTDNTSVSSFYLDVFARAYALGPPKQLLSSIFFDETLSRFNYEEVFKSWIEDPTLVIHASLLVYPNSWFREPLSLLVAMFC